MKIKNLLGSIYILGHAKILIFTKIFWDSWNTFNPKVNLKSWFLSQILDFLVYHVFCEQPPIY